MLFSIFSAPTNFSLSQKLPKMFPKINFLLGQPYSEADRSSNARSELKTIKDNFLCSRI